MVCFFPSEPRCDDVQRPRGTARQKQPHQQHHHLSKASLAVSVLVALPVAMAQSCVSLAGSTTCPSFRNASISTGLSGDFSFLSFVSDVDSFDSRLRDYIGTAYVRTKYQDVIGCSSINLTNTTDTYARYTTTFLCNAIVQASVSTCNLNDAESRPLCADSCAQFAISEQTIASTPSICGTPGSNANDQIRSDLTRCQLATRTLSTANCINAWENESLECGYGSNLGGLCSFCATSSPNSTDSCCVNANVSARCVGIKLPTTSSMPPLFTATTTTTTTAAAAAGGSGLSGGAIAGIVVGSLIGAALLLGAIILGCIFIRRRKQNQQGSMLNTPSPTRQQAMTQQPMSYGDAHTPPPPVLPGARVARMSALEGSSSSDQHSSVPSGGLAAYRPGRDAYDSPESRKIHLGGDLPKRDGSLSSHSALGLGARSGYTSPLSGSDPERDFSSPDGVASGQSEQLQFFKDYYSQDDIRPNDTVSTLWAYQPRANDEFELERGDMLKVVGIWDDGWATGLKLSESAERWEARRALQRDSGVSNGSRQSKIETDSEIKAFPLVCVCLPEHWRKTIEGDSTDGGGGPPPSP